MISLPDLSSRSPFLRGIRQLPIVASGIGFGTAFMLLLTLSGCDKSAQAFNAATPDTAQPEEVAAVEELQRQDGAGSGVESDAPSAQGMPSKSRVDLPTDQTSMETGKHQVTLRSKQDEQSYVLAQSLSDAQLQIVNEAGGHVTPSGRTGPVLRFGSDRSVAEVQTLLEGAEISLAGQLLEFRMKTTHEHEFCGSCLVGNYSAISQVEGVIAVPRYLGDAAGEEVDVVVDPLKVSSQTLIKLLEVDHTQLLH